MTRSKANYHFLIGLALLLAGCTVGPKYQRASAPVPAHWDVPEPWRESAPSDALPKGEWWAFFHDDTLNSLEKDSLAANQTLKVAAAHLEQARASVAIQVSYVFPQAGVSPSVERQRLSGNRPSVSSVIPTVPITQSSYTLPFSVSYEVDLFGRRRRTIESAQAAYQASAADLENTRLIITAELAGDYFTLRQVDTQIGILRRTVEALSKGLDLVNSRHAGGVASGLDVAQEETLLNTTRTQAILLQQQRKQLEDAIAILVGKPAPDFHLPTKELEDEPPTINAGLPSDLLERRPDIAEAERQMAVANAQVGIARAAYFPSLNLFANGGWQAADIAKLLNVQSTLWAFGANAAESIFTGGARRAQVQFAKAGYDASVASYRETVLNAFGEVQDDVTGLLVLNDAQKSQQDTVDAARRTLQIAESRYTGGLVSYLDVVSAQQNLLNNEQQMAIIRGQKLVTSVLLVKALGGGWDSSSLASLQVKPKLKDVVAP
ncbi:MAG TPA: efflux transporter outer membrane subunit [Candidatus Dormibacteraeota bacterium]|nr:efflux transporter outer membrane subunit [Candidatus Dormibacteraeota bacterium]